MNHPSLALDFQRLFDGLPTAYLVMDDELTIVEVNRAYCELLDRTRADLLGRYVFDAFPPAPDAIDDDGQNTLQASFERARDTGRPDALPLYTYSVADPTTGDLVQRQWSLIAAPLPAQDGQPGLVLQRVEDVSDFVRAARSARVTAVESGTVDGSGGTGGAVPGWDSASARTAEVEAELHVRVQQLHTARAAEQATARTLAALAEATVALAGVTSAEELSDVVLDQGLSALGAQGGALALRDSAVVKITMRQLGDQAALSAADMETLNPLPASSAATTGERTYLRDWAACEAHSPEMAAAARMTGCPAWAFLPLLVDGEPQGSLSVAYTRVQTFPARVVEVLEAFAAQCAQALERLRARAAEQAASEEVARFSETMQRSLLTNPPQPDHLDVAVRYVPAAVSAQVGGDWYDTFVTSAGVTSIVIGDVTGHDHHAAAAMGQLRNLLRGIGYSVGAPPAAVLTELDRALAGLGVGALASVVLAQVEQSPEQRATGVRTLRWSNAGHLPPLLVSPSGAVSFLETASDLLVGLDPEAARTDHTIVLEPGASVVLFTDGLIERRGVHLQTGLDWLTAAVADLAHPSSGLSGEEICDGLLAQVGDRVEDDVALLVVRVHSQPRTGGARG